MSRRAKGSGSIFYDKSRGRWAAVVSAGYNPASGQRIRLTRHTKTQREAVMAIKKLLVQVDSEMPIKSGKVGDVTLSTIVESYISLFKKDVKPKTARNLKDTIRHINRFAGNIRLSEVTTSRLQAIINSLAAAFAPVTVKKDFQILAAALRVSEADGLLPRKPDFTRLKFPTAPHRRQHIITDEDFEKILAAASGKLGGLAPLIFCIARYMGLRRAEIAGMTWDNLRDGLYFVSGQLSEDGELIEPKTAAAFRAVPIPPQILAALKRQRRRQAADLLRLGLPRTDFIFSIAGKPYNLASISAAFCHSLRQAGIEHRTLHDLRHTYASDMAARVDVKTLQGLLGHTSSKMSLDVYAESIPDKIRSAVCPCGFRLSDRLST